MDNDRISEPDPTAGVRGTSRAMRFILVGIVVLMAAVIGFLTLDCI